jgi:hypothetical protein
MAQSLYFFQKKHLSDDDHKMGRLLGRTPATHRGSGVWTHKEILCEVTDKL